MERTEKMKVCLKIKARLLLECWICIVPEKLGGVAKCLI